MSFFSELKRRNVFKVAIAYIVVAWLVMQVADVVLNKKSEFKGGSCSAISPELEKKGISCGCGGDECAT